MKLGIFIILALALGVFGAHFLLEDTGYVLIDFRGTAIEMSVPFMIFALLAVYVLIRIVVHLLRLPRQLGQAYAASSGRRSVKLASKGLIQIAEGHPDKGERLLTRGARHRELPLLNYIEAARAAHAQGADERRDTWLKMAREHQPEAATAILLTQAELQIDDDELDEATATLGEVDANGAHRGRLLALQARILRARGDFDGIAALLPDMTRAKALPPEDLDNLRVETASVRLAQAAQAGDTGAIEAAWTSLPKPLRARRDMFAAYARALARCGDHDALEKKLRRSLKTGWDNDLIAIYGELETTHREDPVLLLAGARLCMQNQLWGKARSYLETSLAIQPNAEAYQVYGRLLDKMGESDAATEAFRLGLESATGAGDRPALAAPTTPAN
jgi:HemY protein